MSNEHAARRIREHRVGLALSPEQYAHRIGVCGATVRRVESGVRPFLSTQQKFAVDLGCSHVDLFGVAEAPAAPARVDPATELQVLESLRDLFARAQHAPTTRSAA
jgi:transcriptional regulator with XRE-family HTH domain